MPSKVANSHIMNELVGGSDEIGFGVDGPCQPFSWLESTSSDWRKSGREEALDLEGVTAMYRQFKLWRVQYPHRGGASCSVSRAVYRCHLALGGHHRPPWTSGSLVVHAGETASTWIFSRLDPPSEQFRLGPMGCCLVRKELGGYCRP